MDETFKWGGNLPVLIILLTMLTPKLFQMPVLMYRYGGIAILIAAAPLLLLFAVPLTHLQITLGQYAGLGPYGLLRAFPLGRGIGIAWLILSFMSICQLVVDQSLILQYLVPTLSTRDFPWMKCNQSWNNEPCQPIFENATYDLSDSYGSYDLEDSYASSAAEYFRTRLSFEASSIGGILVYWIFISMPLIQGPKSLIKCLIVGFIIVHGFNALLFFLALSLPGIGMGLAYMFEPSFYSLDINFPFYFGIISGSWFYSSFGTNVFLGKQAESTTFTLPHVLISVIIFLVMSIFNSIKAGGFIGFYALRFGRDPGDFFGTWMGWFTSMPALLSQIRGSNFWLFIHFVSKLLSGSIPSSLALEVIASSFSEFLPGILTCRTKFPRSAILPFVLAGLGFPLSILFLYLKNATRDMKERFFTENVHSVHEIIFMVFFYIVAFAILPLSLSKVANIGREDLLQFVSRQGSQQKAQMRKVFTVLSVFLSAIVAYAWPLMIFMLFSFGAYYWELGLFIDGPASLLFVVILLGCAILIGILAAIVQCVLHCVKPLRNPCCRSLGRSLEPEEAVHLEEASTMKFSPI